MKLGHRIRDALKNAVENIGDGIKDSVKAVGDGLKGVGHMLGSAARLDFKGIAAGASEIAHAVTEVAKNAMMMTPLALAANTLLDDKLEKFMDKVEDVSTHAFDAVANGLAASAEQLKDGVVAVGHGVITGDMGEVLSGVAGAAMGGLSLLPSQIALNAVATGVGSVVGDVIPGKVGDVLGNVASSVVGIKNVAEGALTAGVTAVASSGVGAKLQGVIPDGLAIPGGLAPAAMLAGNALMVGSVMADGRKPNAPGPHHAPPDRIADGPSSSTTHGPSDGPAKRPDAPVPPGSPQPMLQSRVDGQMPAPKVELANVHRADTADVLRQQNWTDAEMKELKTDLRDYFNSGNDGKRQEMEAKWSGRLSDDLSDADVYKKLFSALKDVR
jgi:hypothetical protein